MSDINAILDRLHKVKKSGDGYTALCPSHEDRNPSLSLKKVNGKIVLHCHGGCSVEDVCKSLGIGMSDLFDDTEVPTKHEKEEKVYVYQDAKGVPIYEVIRYPGKKFRQRAADGTPSLKGIPSVPYRLQELLATAKAGGVICIVEGEKDVEALRSVGTTATCNSGGAGKWKPEYGEYFRGAIAVVVVDKDEPGRKHGEQVRESLVGKAKEIHMRQARKGKDAADHIAAGYTVKEFLPLKDRRPVGITTATEMADNAIRAVDAPQSAVPVYPNPWGLAEPEFAKGRLYILSGWTGHGKSVVAAEVFRHLSAAGVRVGYITNEMTETDLRNRLLCHKGFRLKELEKPWLMSDANREYLHEVAGEFRTWNSDIIFDTEVDYVKAGDYMTDGAYEFLIMDHLHRISQSASGEEAEIAKQVRGFTNLALNEDIPVLLLTQLRRPPHGITLPKPTIHDFKGSSAIEQEAAMAMAVWRDGVNGELHFLKNRHGKSGNVELLNFVGERFSFAKGE